MVDSGMILLKFWLEVSPEEQTRRLEARIDDGAQDLEALADGSRILQPLVRLLAGPRRDVLAATDTDWAPWYVVRSDDKSGARAEYHHPPAEQGCRRRTCSRQEHPLYHLDRSRAATSIEASFTSSLKSGTDTRVVSHVESCSDARGGEMAWRSGWDWIPGTAGS